MPPALLPQDPQGCPGTGPRTVPTSALLWLVFAALLLKPVLGHPEQRGGCTQAAGQAGHSPLCSHHSCLALGLWAQDAGTWLPAASASRAAASFPGSCRCQAACLRWAGQRGPLAINHPDLPCCPSDEDVCPGAVSEQGSSTGRGAAPLHPGWVPPALAFLSVQGQGAGGSRGPERPAAAVGCPRRPGQPRCSSKSAEPLGKFDPC